MESSTTTAPARPLSCQARSCTRMCGKRSDMLACQEMGLFCTNLAMREHWSCDAHTMPPGMRLHVPAIGLGLAWTPTTPTCLVLTPSQIWRASQATEATWSSKPCWTLPTFPTFVRCGESIFPGVEQTLAKLVEVRQYASLPVMIAWLVYLQVFCRGHAQYRYIASNFWWLLSMPLTALYGQAHENILQV